MWPCGQGAGGLRAGRDGGAPREAHSAHKLCILHPQFPASEALPPPPLSCALALAWCPAPTWLLPLAASVWGTTQCLLDAGDEVKVSFSQPYPTTPTPRAVTLHAEAGCVLSALSVNTGRLSITREVLSPEESCDLPRRRLFVFPGVKNRLCVFLSFQCLCHQFVFELSARTGKPPFILSATPAIYQPRYLLFSPRSVFLDSQVTF